MTAPGAAPPSRLRGLAVGALGVVYGDIGTSPLYAFRESFIGHHRLPIDTIHVLGVLSMLVWALLLVVTLKYVVVTMRADNEGEGGSFALLALIERRAGTSRWIGAIALVAVTATALFYGDAMITPAISILSAVEGLSLIDPAFSRAVVPLTLAIVVLLFVLQTRGTGRLGALFGPVMILFFVTIALLGLHQVIANPTVLAALDPRYALGFLTTDPVRAFFTLGTVVLAITGAEALYADMGHFGRRPIALTWTGFVLPSLLLCYAGQSALVLADPAAIRSPFFLLAPPGLTTALVTLSTLATIIASQSIISGAFSVTQQAVQLGYLPRIRITNTHAHHQGQVYAPFVNWLLFAAVVGLVLGFGSSTALAAAFGLAVTATMVLTTLLIGFVMFVLWRWNPLWAVPLFALLLALDLGLFAASATKLLDGGWLPVTVAIVIVIVMTSWRRGRTLLEARLDEQALPLDTFIASTRNVLRVAQTAVYLTATAEGVPAALLHNLKHNKILHDRILLVTIVTPRQPHVAPEDRASVEQIDAGFTRIVLRFGFMDQPNVPTALAALQPRIAPLAPMTTSYFLSRQTVIPSAHPGMALWREHLFARLAQAAETPMAFFGLPPNRVVELGSQVEI